MDSLPLNWSPYNSDGQTNFAVTASPTPALSGARSFSVESGSNGSSQDVSRAWLDQTDPADVQVSAAVYVTSLIPAQVIARGRNLDAPEGANGPSFYAVQLSRSSPGPKLELVKEVNGTLTSLGSIVAPNYVDGSWLRESLDVEGSTVRAQLFYPNYPSTGEGEYLNSSGQWQSTPAWALTVIDNSVTGPGVVGLGRKASYTGTVTFDDFSVQTPASDQSFDATPVGSTLPDNWSQWGTGGGTYISIADPTDPTPPSGPNALAIAPPQSGDSARAWLNTSLPADLSVSADTYLSVLTPAQVLARGSNLDSSTPTYYAVEVSRGMTVTLVKVVNGTETGLGSLTSTNWLTDVWVQETLALSGDTLEAQVYRLDTKQYLNSNGDWQSTQTWILNTTDSSISGGGQAGVARPVVQEYVDTNYFDDFTTATGMDGHDFDASTTLSSSVWQQYSSDGNNNYFSVTAGPNSNFLSDSNVLESAEMNSTVMSQVWDGNETLTNAQVSAGVYIVTTMPTLQVIARGTELLTNSPSYYGLSVQETSNGLTVELVRVNGGTATPLGTVQSYPYINTWVQETLYVDGDNLRASVYRTDTGQYLNSDGQWQTLPTYTLNFADTDSNALNAAGYAGIARPINSPTYPGYLDNFAVTPLSADSTPPTVTLTVPSGTLTGDVTVTATPTQTVPGYTISKVEFYVDNVLSWVATASPYSWDFDTRSVGNGTHTLLVKAYDDEGNIGEATTTITTSNNTTLSMPSGFPPHPNSSVGITELDYSNTDADQTLVQNYVDTVIGEHQPDLGNIHTWDSSVQQLLYTNVSNIALTTSIANASDLSSDALLAWLNYAETNDINPEDAFYHVAVATPYSGSGHSTEPVDEFWAVYDPNGTNEYSTAYTGGSLSFGGSANQAIEIGYPDQFWEINFNLTSGASGGWSYVLEYPTAVDSSGNPTSWATLSTLSDTTDGLTKSGLGQMTFNAPSNWVPASIDGSATMYFVRIRTVTAGTAPVADTIKGDNYTNSPAGSDASGVIPAYDWALDPTGGYLDRQEYAIAAAAGYTAHFGYQSRLFYDGPMRFYTNPSNPEFDTWAVDQYYPELLGQTDNVYTTGLFVDNSTGNPPGQGAGAVERYNIVGNNSSYKIDLMEPTDSYSNDYATLLNEIGLAIAPSNGWILANPNGSEYIPGTNKENGQTYADPVIQKVQGYWEEFGLSAVSDDKSQFLSLYDKVYNRATNDNPSYAVIDSNSTNVANQKTETSGQTQLTTLAAYYLLAPSNPNQGALDFFGGESPSSYWVVPNTNPTQYQHWSPAAAYNIGTPENPLPSTPVALVANGSDPENSNYKFNVYERSFTGSNGQSVLVLYKTVSEYNGNEGTNDPQTATTVTLPGSYYVLQPDGTLSSTAVTSISLENGEGAILVDPPTSPPAMAGGTMVAAAVATSPASETAFTTLTSGSAVSQGRAGLTSSALTTAEFFDGLFPGLFLPHTTGASQAPIAHLADPFAPWANLDHLFAAWVTAKLLKPHGNSSSSHELVWPAEEAVAALFTASPDDDPLNPSPAN